ncbi:MAG: nucleotidyltransferase family protein [Sediminibacterium sp.]|nr:nucleotidyltransferase family protein [Sediminibacterium sp.]
MKTGAIILAAGAASRMGKAKMLLPYQGITILEQLISELKTVAPQSICLVTGKYHEAITQTIGDPAISLVYNKAWSNGMAGSIQAGMKALLQQIPDLDLVWIVVGDQPFLCKSVLQEMLRMHQETHKGIVAAQYKGIAGTPVLFSAVYFAALQKLSGDKGARVILQEHPEDIALVAFPQGELDIDTPEDYERFLQQLNQQDAERPIQPGS